jgi:hypothetical protein
MTEGGIRIRSWVKASDAEIRTGLLGYLSIHYGDLVLDGVTLRRKSDGGFALSWPAKTDRGGRRHAYVRPVDDRVRRAIEREVLAQLGQREDGRDAAEGQT